LGTGDNRENRGTGNPQHSPVVDADDFPFFVDASAPKFLRVVSLAGGEEEGGHSVAVNDA
jgi:hypothetical protein